LVYHFERRFSLQRYLVEKNLYLDSIMDKIFIIACLLTILFVIFKFLEMKYIEKEYKPLKLVVRDAVFVFLAGFSSMYLIFYFDNNITEFYNILTGNKTVITNPMNTQVFTDEPGF